MAKTKDVCVLFVGPITKEMSLIGCEIPAHVKLAWRDDLGRRCVRQLPLDEEYIDFVRELPDAVEVE